GHRLRALERQAEQCRPPGRIDEGKLQRVAVRPDVARRECLDLDVHASFSPPPRIPARYISINIPRPMAPRHFVSRYHCGTTLARGAYRPARPSDAAPATTAVTTAAATTGRIGPIRGSFAEIGRAHV